MKTIANILGFAYSAKEALLFHHATKQVRAAQESILRKIIAFDKDTAYGKRFGFSEIRSVEDYRARVPLIEYSDIGAYIGRIAAGEKDVLFPGKPLCLQPTSGTSSEPKLIPFTAALREQYQRGVSPWNFDIHAKIPSLLKGRVYWSLSPVVTERKLTSGKIPLGFMDDTQYLTPGMGYALRQVFAVPNDVGFVGDTELFRHITMAFLLKANDLVYISVWNPTFFLLLLESLSDNFDHIAEDIQRGEISVSKKLPEMLRNRIAKAFGTPDRKRAEELRKISKDNRQTNYSELWHDLKLISCWDHAEAKGPAERLRRLFPKALIQPKGLMSTEGVVSFPLCDAKYPVLSLLSHFYEFIPADNDSEVRSAWELREDRVYEVVLTTGGGLYRYKTGDMIKIPGFYHNCPMIEFIGRGKHFSDFYGEKLHQSHISEIIGKVFSDRCPASYFAILAPDGEKQVDHYTLFVASDDKIDENRLCDIGIRFEHLLRSNFHYDYCRKLGQLKELEVSLIGYDVRSALGKFMEELKHRGIREGNIKPSVLDNRPVWKRVFGLAAGQPKTAQSENIGKSFEKIP